MYLDIRTLSLATSIFSMFFGLGLITYSLIQKQFRGIMLMGSGAIAMGLGFGLISAREVLPDFLSIVLANSLIMAFPLITLEGILRFMARTLRWKGALYVLLALCTILFVHYTSFDARLAPRIITVSLYVALLNFLCAGILFNGMKKELKAPIVLTAFPIIMNGAFLMIRAAYTFFENPDMGFMKAGTVHGIAVLLILSQVIMTSFGYIFTANRMLEIHLEELTRIDPLTGLYNRRALIEMAPHIMAQSERSTVVCSFIMIDIDHFKMLNDKYGHQAGDHVLGEFSLLMKKNVRGQDILSRYGGEEFIILMPNTMIEDAISVAERIRGSVETSVIIHDNGQIRFTVSCGVASNIDGSITWEALVKKADDALYRAKQSGRNRVMT